MKRKSGKVNLRFFWQCLGFMLCILPLHVSASETSEETRVYVTLSPAPENLLAREHALKHAVARVVADLVALNIPEQQRDSIEIDPVTALQTLQGYRILEETVDSSFYRAGFAVQFQPERLERLLKAYGAVLPENWAKPVLVLPIFSTDTKKLLWEQNEWRDAWLSLSGRHPIVPIVIPLGDIEEQHIEYSSLMIPSKAEVILAHFQQKYGVQSVWLAEAELEGQHTITQRFLEVKLRPLLPAEEKTEKYMRVELSALEQVRPAYQKMVSGLYAALRNARLRQPTEANVTELAVEIAFDSIGGWLDWQDDLQKLPFLTKYEVVKFQTDKALLALNIGKTPDEFWLMAQKSDMLFEPVGNGQFNLKRKGQ